MKIIFFCFALLSIWCVTGLSQNFKKEPIRDKQKRVSFTHSQNNNSAHFPQKSFYRSKEDWQYIIDTTWGPGLPLADKRDLFNSFTQKLDDEFDGFQSLGMSMEDWDTLKSYYYNQIDSNTSRGGFCAIMQYLCLELRDFHTWCDDIDVLNSPLNPGVPYFFEGNVYDVSHFGAVTTVLPDSSVLILRVAENHPLNLEPGDIILGYEGVPWKDLITELMDAKLPNSDWWGGSNSAITNNLFVLAGMNWHLFETMDVLKYSTGDTVHLSLAPMVNTQFPPMFNNEQMEIPNIPFPDYYNDDPISYGVLENTNIGYIYVFAEYPPPTAESEFLEAISALKETDALIIDMRLNFGGDALWQNALNILNNKTIYPFDGVDRCDPATFDLCRVHNEEGLKVSGSGPTKYDRPIAILLGPSCVSYGEFNAYRLRYLYNVRTFGKPTCGSMGVNTELGGIGGWTINYSYGDKYEINYTGDSLLNRKEFPIDFPVWHNRDDVAQGKDAVVEKALDWINNLVYPHNTTVDEFFHNPGDPAVFSTTIENPNAHQLSSRVYVKTSDNIIIDSVDLVKQSMNPEGEEWTGSWNLPATEEFYQFSLTVFDETISDTFTDPLAAKFTTAGPVGIDSLLITYNQILKTYLVQALVKNSSQTTTVKNLQIFASTGDSSITSITGSMTVDSLVAQQVKQASGSYTVRVDTNTFSGVFSFNFTINSDSWQYWKDSVESVVTGVEEEDLQPITYRLGQNFPNPFNPTTTIRYQLPTNSKVLLKIYDVLGREVATLVNKEQDAGRYSVQLSANAYRLASGIYIYRLQAGNYVSVKKLMLLK